MRYAGLFLIVFMCFPVMDAFCGGGGEIKKLQKQLDEMRQELDDVTKKEQPNEPLDGVKQGQLDEMKNELNVFKKSLDEISKHVGKLGGPGDPGPSGDKIPLVPITSEIIALAESNNVNINDLNYYLSMTLTMVINKDENNVNSVSTEGASFRLVEKNSTETIQILSGVPGKLKERYVEQDVLGKKRKSFEIVFPDSKSKQNSFLVKFVQNEGNSVFVLDTVKIGSIEYTYTLAGKTPPLLCINYEYSFDDKSEIFVQGRVNQTAGTANREGRSAETKPQERRTGRNRYIIGSSSLDMNKVADFIKRKNPNIKLAEIQELLEIYEEEAAREGVNVDIAIAQMCRATDYLKIKGYNYAGLSMEGTTRKITNMKNGVRAHIQHLKAYADKSGPKQPIVNPRHEILGKLGYYGTVKTFDDLYSKWAPGRLTARYTKDIEGILCQLRAASDEGN